MRHDTYWGLRESPFRHSAQPSYFFASSTHEEALARLHFLVEGGGGLGIVSGDEGTGKSLVLDVLARQLRDRGQPVCRLALVGLEPRAFLWSLAAALGTNPPRAAEPFTLGQQISDRLQENRYEGRPTILLLDDADQATLDVRVQILRLVKTRPDHHLTTVLAAASSRVPRLGQDLLSLCDLRIHLDLWGPDDLRDYLRTVLARAGRQDPQEVFDDSAVERLWELTSGVPRRVNQLAELVLVAGAGRRLDQINAELLDSVFQELGPLPAQVALPV